MKKLVLLDMDGTVYLGDKLLPRVEEVFSFFKENGIKFIFLTNNSSHSISYYNDKMNRLGIKTDLSNFYSSTEVTKQYLRDHGAKNIYVLGVTSFKEMLSKEFNLIDKYKKGTSVDYVVVAFDTELKYDELKDACLYIQDGVKFIATNMDYRCPIEDGYYIPDCGGLCEWIKLCTNVEPQFLGKPSPVMIEQVLAINNVKHDEAIICGDRYYTDIKAGINAGIDTFGVLTGETTQEMYDKVDIKPTYLRESLFDIIEVLKNEK